MRSFSFLFLISLFPAMLSSQQIVINEIMFDVPGADYHDEYVELFNAGEEAITFEGWRVGDGDETDAIIAPDTVSDLVLEPSEYLLILDGSYSGNSTAYDSILTGISYAFIDDGSFGKSGFANSYGECVVLINADGDTVDRHLYTADNEPGFSDERKSPFLSGYAQNWGNSLFSGGTPGMINSIALKKGEPLLLNFRVESKSTDKINLLFSAVTWSEATLTGEYGLTVDENFSGEANSGEEKIISGTVDFVPGETATVERTAVVSGSGNMQYVFTLRLNERDTAFVTAIFLDSGETEEVIINEVFFAPADGEWEWIELYNPGSGYLSLRRYELVIGADTLPIPDDAVIKPEGFLILSEEEGIPGRFGNYSCRVVKLREWNNLRITEEYIGLIDPLERVADTLHYDDSWWKDKHGNRSFEKKGPELPNIAGNWGFSLSDAGGTPGRVNSWIRGERLGVEAEHLKFNSALFSPARSDLPAVLEIAVEMESSGDLKLIVFDLRGRPVRVLVNDTQLPGLQYFLWDGRNEAGLDMPAGTYLIFVEFSSSGERWKSVQPVALVW